MSGRVTDFAVYEPNPSVYYVAAAHGGLWKTTNNGVTFTAEFQDQGLMSIGDVAVSQKDPNLVWVGTGEGNNRQSTSWGDGIYKSTDGGKTFKPMGLVQSYHINRIAIDPDDNNIVFVAAQGSVFGPGGDRGVYKTIDGGATWKTVLKVDENTGANEIQMDPSNHLILYASTYQRQRSQCCFNGGGPGSGLWKSVDAGETWTRLKTGLPPGSLGRIGLDIYRKSPNILYALVEAEGGGGRGAAGAAGAVGLPAGAQGAQAGADAAAQGGGGGRGGAGGGDTGLYRSDDGGATWHKAGSTNPRPMYFSQVRIDPNNPDHLLIANVQVMLSTNGGAAFANADATIHDDIHGIWWDPRDSNHIMIGGDGGVGVSFDYTKTWHFLNNLPIGLFYHAGLDNDTPFNVCGGMQDNDAWCGPSAVRNQRGISNEKWSRLQIGDGMVVIPDPLDARIVYSSTQDGSVQRKNKITGESKSIRPQAKPGEPALRFNWDTPMTFSPIDHALLVTAQKVFRSTDRGDSWTAISPDLTNNASREDLTIMGAKDSDVRISKNDGISAWPTIVTVAESARQAGVFYAGTDDGVVSVTKDGGKTWDKTLAERMPGFPKGAWVSEVVPSRFDAGTVYVTVDAHRLNDFNTYIWASRDFGATFQSIGANLKGEVIKTLTEDQRNADVLYLGAETGLLLTLDRGKSWSRFKANFPTVRVDEITLQPRDNAMVLATHGRSFWVLDHLEPIQEYAAAMASPNNATLFSVPRALEWKSTDELNMEFWGDDFSLGENPPFQAVVQFHLKRAVTDVKLSVTDAVGKSIRELVVANHNQPGIQTTCWDLRVEPLPAAGGAGGGRGGGAGGGGGRGGGAAVLESGPTAGFSNPCGGGAGGGGRGGGGAAPYVLPGAYNVALVVDGKVADTKSMKVAMDPAIQMSDAQLKRYYDITMDLHDLQRRGEEAATAMAPFFTQMSNIAAKLPDLKDAPADVKASFAALNREFDAARVKFGVPAAAAGGGGRGGGGGGGRGGGAAPENLVTRAGTLKTQILAFWEMPGDTLMKEYADIHAGYPKAVSEINAVYTKATAMVAALKKYDFTLNVPVPAK
jgi:photosystem II stability/assembly factor-like uncharacterized protein